jgi:limonene-1,2-epoxide hydrolase
MGNLTAADPLTSVLDFLAAFGRSHDEDLANYRRHTTADVRFESGQTTLSSRDDLTAYITAAIENFGVATLKVDVLHAAAHGDVVLTERVDHLDAPDGTEVYTLPVAGAFEIREGKVSRWRDYYDTARIHRRDLRVSKL